MNKQTIHKKNVDICECIIFEQKSKYNVHNQIKISDMSLQILPSCLSHLTHITSMYCMGCKITTITSLPPQLMSLYLVDNFITNIDPKIFPKTLTDVNLSNNKFQTFDTNSSSFAIRRLILSNNQLTYFDMRNTNIIELWLSNNELKHLICNEFIEKLDVDNNINININFENAQQLTHLYMSKCNVFDIVELPNTIQQLDISCNCIKNINKLPNKLAHLNCTKNLISTITFVPHSLKILHISGNQLEKLILINDNLNEIYCSSNKIKLINTSCGHLICYDNPLEKMIINKLTCNIEYNYSCNKNLLITSIEYIDKLHTTKKINDKTYKNLIKNYVLSKCETTDSPEAIQIYI